MFSLVHKLAPVHRGQGGTEKGGKPSQMGGGRINKQRNLLYPRLLLGGYKMGRSPHSLTRIFQVHIEALPGSRHLYGPDGLSATFLSHGRARGAAPSSGKASRMQSSRTREGARSL